MIVSELGIPGYSLHCDFSGYVSELKAAKSAEQLRNFVEKWKAIYKIVLESDRHQELPDNITNVYRRLVELDFDVNQAVDCIMKSREDRKGFEVKLKFQIAPSSHHYRQISVFIVPHDNGGIIVRVLSQSRRPRFFELQRPNLIEEVVQHIIKTIEDAK